RTWTYVSFRPDWVPDAVHWQERARAIEDKLSDALHERLRQRFVDRRTAVLVSKLKASAELAAAVRADGTVLVEGEHVGALKALRFIADEKPTDGAGRMVMNAAERALRAEFGRRARALADSLDTAFGLTLAEQGRPLPRILWNGEPVGRLVAGGDHLAPDVHVLADDGIEAKDRDQVRKRLRTWVAGRIELALKPLLNLSAAKLTGPARGLAFQLREGFGSRRRDGAETEIAALDKEARQRLRQLGVRIGRDCAYMAALLKPDAIFWRGLLWQLANGQDRYLATPAPGRVSVPLRPAADRIFLEACGFMPLGPLAVRIDMAERLSSKAWVLANKGPFQPSSALTSMVGANNTEFPAVMRALGFRRTGKGESGLPADDRYAPAPAARHPAKRRLGKVQQRQPVDPASPFAKLGDLSFGD
ncbi:MAG: hypothetical protein O2944_08830, partial [Proteobacteria bacterium]|nr:hypothetical protein [Pseudomonadota bacterium]